MSRLAIDDVRLPLVYGVNEMVEMSKVAGDTNYDILAGQVHKSQHFTT